MFEVATAYAMGAAPQGAEGGAMGMLAQFAPLVVMFAIFYFLLIRPQQKRAKEHKAMLDGLKNGDQVVTTGGLIGRITHIEGDILTIDLGETKVKVGRGYVTGMGNMG